MPQRRTPLPRIPAFARGPCTLAAALFMLGGCATAPSEPVSDARATGVARTDAPVCPPAPAPICPTIPEPRIAPPTPGAGVEFKGRLKIASWLDLPDWGRDPLAESLAAFLQGCPVLEAQEAWKAPCAAARTVSRNASARELAEFFERHFDPHQVLNADDTSNGTVTGYYEPLLRGSRMRTARYRHPIYAVPPDLVTIDLSSVYPDLKNRRLRGRVEGGTVVPYHARGDIDRETGPLRGLELAWIDDPVDVFFLHIQGSGQVQFENGERIRVGYADQNGHPFRSVARMLIQRRELPAERTDLQGMRDWARRHPRRAQNYLNANPSYVFFKELPQGLAGPIGTLGVPLTAERSIAVDPRVIPLGVPVYLATTWPGSPQPLRRLVVAQDTGGAIAGGVRADFYWGFGDGAGAQAGRMKQNGRMWVLLPKGYVPPAGAVVAP